MKKIFVLFAIASFGLALTSCSDAIFDSASNEDGCPVKLTLQYKDVSPTSVTITRSGRTEEEEKRLKDIKVFIFNANTGKLKGYKHITTGLKQDTYDENGTYSPGTIDDIKTTSGDSYIFAIANDETNNYSVGLPTDVSSLEFDEDKAQNEEIDFTLSQFKQIAFKRTSGNILISDGYFLMSGAIEDSNKKAEKIAITSTGISGNNNVIHLRRVVSKVKFEITDTYVSDDGTTYKFNFQSYDIINIPTRGNLIQEAGYASISDDEKGNNEFQAKETQKPDQQVDYNGFVVYLPENMQAAKNTGLTTWEAREADNNTTDKKFTNAPDDGTYVVLHGTYSETKNGSVIKDGTTDYTIHLGDFTKDKDDFDNERNYFYTYKIKVQGVNSIIAEAKKENGNETEQPGAEGVIFEYTTGRSFELDSHYEYCVMRFYQDDIKTLKADGRVNKGYCFRVYGLNNDHSAMAETKTIFVTDQSINNDDLNGVDISWISFLKGGTYNSANTHGGNDSGYKNLWDNAAANSNGAIGIVELLQTLYNNAETDDFWTGTSNGKKYIDYTCYVDENFYTNCTWDKFTNQPSRRFYIANNVDESTDQRSVYAQVAYGITQRSIQTFYNRNKSSQINAYGCEMIDETEGCETNKTQLIDTNNDNGSTNKWDGRSLMIIDNSISTGTSPWSDSYSSPSYLYQACMKRNRDLNHNGTIDDDEIRWFTPSVAQYAGLWIGEPALADGAELYTGETSKLERVHYYTSTYNNRIYWSEEGMAVGNWPFNDSNASNDTKKANFPTHVRCIRYLPYDIGEKKSGYNSIAKEYYSVNTSEGYKFDLSNVDPTATATEVGELGYHHEREDENKVSSSFIVANNNLKNANPIDNNNQYLFYATGVYGNQPKTCAGQDAENYTGWRVPNQRELVMMYLGHSTNTSMPLDAKTFCRTHFSAIGKTYNNTTEDRTSWVYDEGNVNMGNAVKATGATGYIRCIKVVK